MPQQSQSAPPTPPAAAPPTPPHASEATRLLCVGTYVDADYRDRVIEELRLNAQRFAAPSPGFDAARVLAHALRARTHEWAWAGAILALWFVGAVVTYGALALFVAPALTLSIAAWLRGRAVQPSLWRRVPAFLLRWFGRTFFALLLLGTVIGVFGGGAYSYALAEFLLPEWLLPDSTDALKPWQTWITLVVFVLVALCLARRRSQFARAVRAELSPQRFPDAAGDPAERTENGPVQHLKNRIRTEQHAPLIMYHEARPFCGAGAAHETWVLAVELRPDSDKDQQPLSNRAVLEKVRPMLERLRVPAEHAAGVVRDRLRQMEIDECVFLPAHGLQRREDTPYTPRAFEEHRARAVEEGAEKRRHFLRIRVGGWDEELVVTVFVRVHTQGSMLMLEVAPHVLLPVRADFKEADRAAHRFLHHRRLRKAAWALTRVPRSFGDALAVLVRAAEYTWQLVTVRYMGARPEGPRQSVRELGSAPTGSQFQDMDGARYLKTIQDRIANGVRAALAESGYQTGEFVQKVVNVSQGAVHIDRVEGSTFAVGSHASASTSTSTVSEGAEPQRGRNTDAGE